MAVRDVRRDEGYFSQLIVDFDDALQETQTALNEGEFSSPTERVEVAQRLFQLSIMRAVAHYSYGTSVRDLSPYVLAILPYRQQLTATADKLPQPHQFYRDDFEKLGGVGDTEGSANINRYVYTLWWLTLLQVSNAPSQHINEALLIIGEQGKDSLLDNIAVALGDTKREVATSLYYPNVYQTLSDVWHATPKKQEKLMNTFVGQWYSKLEEADWYDNHECDCEFEYTDYYIGYWCFEAALVANLLAIPLKTKQSHVVMPKDLVVN